MKLLNCKVTNFGSYPELEIDFSNIGLGLVYGKTGSGKSTLADIAAWALFGITAKGGNADEIRSWDGTGSTRCVLEVSSREGDIEVTRIRGVQGKNDLYWTEESDHNNEIRGKDLTETQKLLEQRLGVSADLYLASSYFHEFSDAGRFFTAKAKDRRELFEGIANLQLPSLVGMRATAARKLTRTELEKAERESSARAASLSSLRAVQRAAVADAKGWQEKQAKVILGLEEKCQNFKEEKQKSLWELEVKFGEWEESATAEEAKLLLELRAMGRVLQSDDAFDSMLADAQTAKDDLDRQRCPECDGPSSGRQSAELGKEILALSLAKRDNLARIKEFETLSNKITTVQEAVNPFAAKIETLKASANHYQAQLFVEKGKENPFEEQVARFTKQIEKAEADLLYREAQKSNLKRRHDALDALYDLSSQLRAELLRKAVHEIEAATNRRLEKHFDAEIRVSFALEDADKLEVSIQKSGHECVYTQLSKGQRQLLKLAFVTSVMKAAANNAGIHFPNLFFDEALDGLDGDLKVKAFGLLQELETEHESILVIDHAPEFQNLFTKRYHVTLEGDYSRVEEISE